MDDITIVIKQIIPPFCISDKIYAMMSCAKNLATDKHKLHYSKTNIYVEFVSRKIAKNEI